MPVWERTFHPSKGLGHKNMRTKLWGKEKSLKERVKGRVWRGLDDWPCTLTLDNEEG